MPGTSVTALLARARVAIEEGDSAGAQLAWDEAERLAGHEAGARSLIQAVPPRQRRLRRWGARR